MKHLKKLKNNFLVITTLFFLITSIQLNGQTKTGFETLKYFKSSLEGTIKLFVNKIPDSSNTYKKYFLKVGQQYNLARASFEGYKGKMINCISQKNTSKKIRACLSSESPNLDLYLDSLNTLLTAAYLANYIENGIESEYKKSGTQNTGSFTIEQGILVINSLIEASIKIFNESSKYKKELKEQFIKEIASKDYVIMEFLELIKSQQNSK
jgi:hypothetical protein